MVHKPEILPATAAHAEALAPLMREADRSETEALGYPSPLKALLMPLASSESAFTVLLGGKVAAMFGVVAQPSETLLGPREGFVWAFTGQAVEQHKKTFVRLSRLVLTALLERFERLMAFVDARYEAAVRWVRWLRFEVSDPEPYGPRRLPFHPIVIRRAAWNH